MRGLAKVSISDDAQACSDLNLFDQLARWRGCGPVGGTAFEPVHGRGEQLHDLGHEAESTDDPAGAPEIADGRMLVRSRGGEPRRSGPAVEAVGYLVDAGTPSRSSGS